METKKINDNSHNDGIVNSKSFIETGLVNALEHVEGSTGKIIITQVTHYLYMCIITERI